MNSINSIHQYNSKKTFKILIAFFILLLVSYMSIFKGIANINLKRVLVTIFRNLSFDNTEALSAREMVVFLDLIKNENYLVNAFSTISISSSGVISVLR